MVLGLGGGDVTIRLLTSQVHGRPEAHVCYEDDTYPAFFLGTPGGVLQKPTWLDLRFAEDIDERDFTKRVGNGSLSHVLNVANPILCPALACAANAAATTPRQERLIWASRTSLGCQ